MNFLIPLVAVILALGVLLVFINWFWGDPGPSFDWFTGRDIEEKPTSVVPTPEPYRPEHLKKPKKVRKTLTFTENVGVTTITYTFKDGTTMERSVMGSMLYVGSDFNEAFQDRMVLYRQKGYFQHRKVTSMEAAAEVLARERQSGFIYWPNDSRMRLFEDFSHADFKTQPYMYSFEEAHFIKEEESLPDVT